MSNIFLTGGSGLFGLNFYYQTRKEHKIYVNFHKKKIPKIHHNNIKLNNIKKLKKFLLKNKIQYLVHSAAITNIEKCQKKKNLCKYINFDIAVILCKICKDINIKFVFISSDHLFDGRKNFYKETDKTFPLNYYSKLKVRAERKIMKINDTSLILRVNFFGFGPIYRRSYSDWIIQMLKENKKIEVFKDVFFNPVDINFFIKIIIILLKKKTCGILNVSSDEKISKYNFAVKIAKKFNLNFNLIIPALYSKIQKEKKLVLRPKNMTLNNKLIKNVLNIKSIRIDNMINNLYSLSSSKNISSIKKIK